MQDAKQTHHQRYTPIAIENKARLQPNMEGLQGLLAPYAQCCQRNQSTDQPKQKPLSLNEVQMPLDSNTLMDGRYTIKRNAKMIANMWTEEQQRQTREKN